MFRRSARLATINWAMRSAAAGAAIIPGCAEPTLLVELELVDGGCTPGQLRSIKMLSLDVFGFRNSNETCNLQKRCVDVLEPPTSIDALSDILADQPQQPLIDTARQGATQINIVGRTEAGSCFKAEPFPVCGRADLASVQDNGTLQITMRCDDCVEEAFAQCP